jgi:ATPase subunit of ABC transporter with duplicated ATPase domains
VILGPSVKVGYYAQQHETLDFSATLIETVRWHANLSEEGAMGFLTRFLFTYQQASGKVGSLSAASAAGCNWRC